MITNTARMSSKKKLKNAEKKILAIIKSSGKETRLKTVSTIYSRVQNLMQLKNLMHAPAFFQKK